MVTVQSIAEYAIERYLNGLTRFPQFVNEIEAAVYVAERASMEIAENLRREWGELEILNALVDVGDLAEIEDVVIFEIIENIERLLNGCGPENVDDL